MKTLNIPEGNNAVMPYLMLENAAGFMEFTKTVFGAVQGHDVHYQPDDSSKIMHAEVVIDGSTIMFCDTRDAWKPTPANMFIYVADVDETYKKALETGAVSAMEISNQSYGRTCGITDPYGNVWWITTVLPES